MKLNSSRKNIENEYLRVDMENEPVTQVFDCVYALSWNEATSVSFFYDEIAQLGVFKPKNSFFRRTKTTDMGGPRHMATTTRVILYAGVFALSIGCGVPLGMVLADFFAAKPAGDYSGLSISTNRASQELMGRYESAINSNADFSDGGFSVMEVMRIAATNFMDEETTSWMCNGSATASILNQTIRSVGFKKGGELFSESLSYSSLVQAGLRSYQKGSEVTYYKASSVNSEATEGSFSGTGNTLSTEGYAEIYGYDLSQFSNYYFGEYTMALEDGSTALYCSVISEKTSSEDNERLSSITRNEEGYEVYVRLDTLGGVANYATQMLNLSELDQLPSFNYCHLTYQLDEKLNPLSVHIDEQYNAKKGANAVTTTSMDIIYKMGTSPDIPELDSPVDYGGSL